MMDRMDADHGSTPTLATLKRKAGGAETERVENEMFALAVVGNWLRSLHWCTSGTQDTKQLPYFVQ